MAAGGTLQRLYPWGAYNAFFCNQLGSSDVARDDLEAEVEAERCNAGVRRRSPLDRLESIIGHHRVPGNINIMYIIIIIEQASL